jgi:3-oxoacyl-(acyl-carrier-protein) synthase
MPLRLATFNVENLFDRAKALNTTTWKADRSCSRTSRNHRGVGSGRGGGGLLLVGAADALEHGLALLVDQAGK